MLPSNMFLFGDCDCIRYYLAMDSGAQLFDLLFLLRPNVLAHIQYECLGRAKHKRRRLLFSADPGVNWTSGGPQV